MKHPQVINYNEDSVMAFIGNDVIEAVTQVPIYELTDTLLVDMKLWDLMSNSAKTITALPMTYSYDARFWLLGMVGVAPHLADRHKYVGTVYGNVGETENLEPFQITEFAVDNESLTSILMRMSYEIVIDGSQAFFFWYDLGHHGEESYRRFAAPAYEGGVGTTYATDPSRVTHRGAIQEYYAGS